MKTTDIQVIPYHPRHRAVFVALNLQWIETHFEVEPEDRRQLEDPETLRQVGGEIFFVIDRGEPVGTCALLRRTDGNFELAKMAVSVAARGKGHGDRLMTAAITWAVGQGAQKIHLLSNTVLQPAIALYHKYGFQVVRLGAHPDYRRCNIEMSLDLRAHRES